MTETVKAPADSNSQEPLDKIEKVSNTNIFEYFDTALKLRV